MILNKIAKFFNKTFTELKSNEYASEILVYFSHNPRCKGLKSTRYAVLPFRPNSDQIITAKEASMVKPGFKSVSPQLYFEFATLFLN